MIWKANLGMKMIIELTYLDKTQLPRHALLTSLLGPGETLVAVDVLNE